MKTIIFQLVWNMMMTYVRMILCMAFIDPDQSALEWKEPKDASFDFELPRLKIKIFAR